LAANILKKLKAQKSRKWLIQKEKKLQVSYGIMGFSHLLSDPKRHHVRRALEPSGRTKAILWYVKNGIITCGE